MFLRESAALRRAAWACQQLGADTVTAPVMDLRDPGPEDYRALNRAIDRLAHYYDWVVLTSQEGVERFVTQCEIRSQKPIGDHPQFAVVGRQTETALRRHGIRVSLAPLSDFSQQGLIDALGKLPKLSGERFLLPLADQARSLLEHFLAQHGAVVERLVLYRTVFLSLDPKAARHLADGAIDGIFYTSPSSVQAFCQNLGPNLYRRFQDAPAFSIGDQTSRVLANHAVTSIMQAPTASIPALVEVAVSFFGTRSPGP